MKDAKMVYPLNQKLKGIKKMKLEKTFEAGIGWAFAKACALLDAGDDPRQFNMANLLPDAERDFAEDEEGDDEIHDPCNPLDRMYENEIPE